MENSQKEMLLKTIVRVKKGKKPPKPKERKLKVDGVESALFSTEKVLTRDYFNSKSIDVRKALRNITED